MQEIFNTTYLGLFKANLGALEGLRIVPGLRYIAPYTCKDQSLNCFVVLALDSIISFNDEVNYKTKVISRAGKASKKFQTLPPSDFFSFRPCWDTLKLERNPKFQVLGSSRTLLLELHRRRPQMGITLC